MDVPNAANVLGTVGAVCWSVQLIPQIVINYRQHDTTGLQPTMMLLWASAGIPLGVYNITQSFNIALQVQPQILTSLSLLTWAQCMYYRADTKWLWLKCVSIVILLGTVMGGVELGLIFALKYGRERYIEWPSTLMAVLSAVLLCAGVLRHYWDIYKERTVRGISFLFVGIDALGDLTSLVSIFFQAQLDVLGVVIYGSELILWLGVFACGGWFNLRPLIREHFRTQRRSTEMSSGMNPGRLPSTIISNSREDGSCIDSSSSVSTVFRTASNTSYEHEVRLRSLNRV